MENTICINKCPVHIKDYNGQRVVTFKEIDQVHHRLSDTARKAFHRNKKRFVLNKDYFVLKTDEAKKRFGITAPNGLTLITESGYCKLVKVFDDDPAWAVQDMLVDVYFQKKLPTAGPKTAPIPNHIAKDYHGIPVMTCQDVYKVTGITPGMCKYYLKNPDQFSYGKDHLLLVGEEFKLFKRDNPAISKFASTIIILYLPAVEKLCHAAGIKFNKDKLKALPAPKAELAPVSEPKDIAVVPADTKSNAHEPTKNMDLKIQELRKRAISMVSLLELQDIYPSEECRYPIRSALWMMATNFLIDCYKLGPVMGHTLEGNIDTPK